MRGEERREERKKREEKRRGKKGERKSCPLERDWSLVCHVHYAGTLLYRPRWEWWTEQLCPLEQGDGVRGGPTLKRFMILKWQR